MLIEITYNVTDVFVSTTQTPIYVSVSFEQPSSGGASVWGEITGSLSDQTDLQTALDAKVPYTGATQDVSLGEYGINVGNVIYDTTPTGIPTDQGATYWDDQAETVALVMNGTIQKIGEDTFYHVKNSTGSTIAKGVAVRFSGTDGGSGKILIAPFLANGTYPSQYYMGITAEAITNGSDGKVYHFGKIRGVNTSAFADGDILYCSTSVAGGFQTTAPSAPNNIVIAAAVINAANNGTLMVRTTTGSNINTDEGVLLTTPTSGQVLKYNGSLWVNDSVSGALGYTPANAATTLTINGVTYDLSANRTFTVGSVTGSGASGQVAYWTGTTSQAGSNNLFWDATNSRLGIGTNAPAVALDARTSANSGTEQIRITNSSSGNLATAGIGIQANVAFGALVATSSTYSPLPFLGANAVGFYSTHKFVVAVVSGDYAIGTGASLIEKFRLFGSTGNLLLQNGGTLTDSGQRLQVQGTTLLNGNVTFSSSTGMFWDATNSRLGIGTNAPTTPFHLVGNGFINGNLAIGTTLNPWDSVQKVIQVGHGAFYGLANGFATVIANNAYFNSTWNYATSQAAALYQIIGGQHGWYNIGSGTAGSPISSFVQAMTLFATRNLAIGSTTDSGQRLQVTGDTLLKGSGNTSGSTALLVENSDGSDLLTILNNGYTRYGNAANNAFRVYPGSVAGNGDVDLSGQFLTLNSRSGATETGTAAGFVHINGVSASATSGIQNVLSIQKGFAPTSGTAVHNSLIVNLTINQTGGANGITRGLYVNPTLTSAADWRSIEWSNNSGWGLYGTGTANNYLGGNLLLGSTTSSGERLQVTGTMKVTGNVAVDTNVLFVDTANDRVGIGTASPSVLLHSSGVDGSNTNVFRLTNTANLGTTAWANTVSHDIQFHYTDGSFGPVVYGSIRAVGNPNSGLINAGTIDTDLSFLTAGYDVGGGLTEKFRIKATGQIRFVPRATAPNGAQAGDVYYNSTDNKHYGYNGTTWNAFY